MAALLAALAREPPSQPALPARPVDHRLRRPPSCHPTSGKPDLRAGAQQHVRSHGHATRHHSAELNPTFGVAAAQTLPLVGLPVSTEAGPSGPSGLSPGAMASRLWTGGLHGEH